MESLTGKNQAAARLRQRLIMPIDCFPWLEYKTIFYHNHSKKKKKRNQNRLLSCSVVSWNSSWPFLSIRKWRQWAVWPSSLLNSLFWHEESYSPEGILFLYSVLEDFLSSRDAKLVFRTLISTIFLIRSLLFWMYLNIPVTGWLFILSLASFSF